MAVHHPQGPVIDEAALERQCIRLIQGVDRKLDHGGSRDLWDATLLTVGWMYMDLERAVAELESVMKLQGDDGLLPRAEGSEGAALPLFTTITRMIYHAARGRRRSLEGRLARLVPELDRFHETLWTRSRRALYISREADQHLLPGAPKEFSGERIDVGLNALLVQAESDLADVAIHTGFATRRVIARRTKRAQAVADHLWCEDEESYGTRLGEEWEISAEGLLALWAGAAPGAEAAQMVVRYLSPGAGYWSRFPFSPVPFAAPQYSPSSIGSGAVSPLLDWLMIRGLFRYGYEQHALQLNHTLLRLASEHGFWEAYDSETGAGVGAAGCPSTAALVLDLIKTPYYYARW